MPRHLSAHAPLSTPPPRWLLSGPDRALVVLAGGAVVALREEPLAVKLDLLFHKQLYPTALVLLQAQPGGVDSGVVADVHRQYAEHLYAKAGYEGGSHPNPDPNPELNPDLNLT